MISQQSLSQQISLLERMLAVRLFDRDSRGTSLTAVGALFLPEARAVLDRADEAMDVVARAARGELAVSDSPSSPPRPTICFPRWSGP